MSVGFQQTIVKINPIWSSYLGIIRTITMLLSSRRLPIIEGIIREQEITADKLAVEITGDLPSSINCLYKLCNYNLKMPSHIWEYGNLPLPIMTMNERVKELIKNLSQ